MFSLTGGNVQQPEVIGAGLPLFERLKLLKQREQEQEQYEKEQQELQLKQQQEQQQQEQQQPEQPKADAEPEPEVIGAGLPLFERLKLLKQREQEKREQEKREEEAAIQNVPVCVEREDKPVKHISFSETPSTPPSARKSARDWKKEGASPGRWTLAVLPKAIGSKLKPPLDSIQSASSRDEIDVPVVTSPGNQRIVLLESLSVKNRLDFGGSFIHYFSK